MEDQDYEVIVIGSGPGGLVCATLLQKRGSRPCCSRRTPTSAAR
ncbi:MAG: FAD-dependent monooxygenase [Microthrixaceae bacterium]|nr:FAD-dependent monooxygenase [Microthrixaceae bacterium]